VVVVDEPQRLAREALVAAIAAAPGLSAVDGSAAGPAAVEQADAAVLAAGSLRFAERGLLARTPRGEWPSPVVIVADHGPVTPSVDGRGMVVVSRETSLRTIVECLRANGHSCLDRSVGDWPASSRPRLTARERQVLGLLASGLSPTEVARALAITTYTARDHVKAIRQKLNRPTIMAAVLEAIRRGELSLDPQ
jgi:two-component system nitrate/nitrite response regulator NarL